MRESVVVGQDHLLEQQFLQVLHRAQVAQIGTNEIGRKASTESEAFQARELGQKGDAGRRDLRVIDADFLELRELGDTLESLVVDHGAAEFERLEVLRSLERSESLALDRILAL